MSKNTFIMVYLGIIRIIVRIILAAVGKLEVSGRQNIPSTGSFLVVSNHLSKTDPAIILLTLPRRRMRVFAASKWRPHPIFGPILGLSGAIWVRRGEPDRGALHEAIRALDNDQVLGMAPEGTRSRSRVLQKARQGAAYIACRANIPILPVGIANSDQFQDNILHARRTHFKVKIGKPFTLPDLGYRPRSKEMAAYTELIMSHIANLLPKRYHGYYAKSPALFALQAGEDPWPEALQSIGLEVPSRRTDNTVV